jgi:NADPH:quinone reductase-like Zn-dependent oxidoreductase
MKVVEVPAYGLDNLKVSERTKPRPGPGQVLLKMKAASLNYRDLVAVQGAYGSSVKLPLVPCSDGCGEVVEVGEGVKRVKVGDRVATLFFQGWFGGRPTPEALGTALGGSLDGCLQEFMLLSEQGVAKVPAHLSDLEAATLSCAALTAWRGLVVEGDVKAGDIVLAQGTGGVSIFALQLAKAAGAEVIITSSSDEKLARARKLGADHVINYKQHPKWSTQVREITGGRGVDHVVEVGGAETLQESLKSVRLGGHISVIGVLSGPTKAVEIRYIFGANARVQGITVGSRENFEDMCRAIDRHKIKPVIDKVFPLEQAKAAFAMMASQSHFGKIAIEIAK